MRPELTSLSMALAPYLEFVEVCHCDYSGLGNDTMLVDMLNRKLTHARKREVHRRATAQAIRFVHDILQAVKQSFSFAPVQSYRCQLNLVSSD